MPYLRERICADCSKIEEVRKDNASIRCVSCAARANGAKGVATIQARRRTAVCEFCNETFRHRRGGVWRFCSLTCASVGRSLDRACVHCAQPFRIYRSVIASRSNGQGKFCSRACYETHLCRTAPVRRVG